MSSVSQGGYLLPIIFVLFISSISRIPHYCRILCFTDDFKIFLRIDILDNSVHLEEDFDRLVE